jgi:CHAD domain-containing protein
MTRFAGQRDGESLRMNKVLEREDKWEVSDQFVLPPPSEAAGDDVMVERSTIELASVYYDTADHDLQHHGVSLRRREGDDDTGWQVKVPASGGRLELRSGLSDTPPAELTDLLIGLRLGKPLSPVATIRTRRERYRITDPQKRALRVELVDDHVRASTDHRLLAWREVEIEEGPAAGSLPRRLARRLAKAGARPARHPTKLAHVYPAEPRRRAGSAAQDAVATYVGDQIAEVFAGDLGLRRGEDPIHDARVAIRRLRSTLRVFGKIFDRAAAGRLDTELKWFAGLLGEVRDCKLQRSRFHSTLDDWPPEVVLGPVIARIDSDLRSTEVRARRDVTDAMASARYLDLLATLQRWNRDLPLSRTPTRKALGKRAKKAQHKAQRRLDVALDAGDGALHEARKAAKRARYAAELCGPGSGKAANKGKHFKRIQRVLGDHQDSVVAAATLYRLGLKAGTTSGENGFTFGLLYAREQRIQESIRRDARRRFG